MKNEKVEKLVANLHEINLNLTLVETNVTFLFSIARQ